MNQSDNATLIRIAEALERIADSLDSRSKSISDNIALATPFPWGEMSVRTWRNVRRYVLKEMERKSELYRGMSWPLSCEDIRKLGKDELLEARNFGLTGWAEVEKKLNEISTTAPKSFPALNPLAASSN